MENDLSPLDQKGKLLERWIVGLLMFVPRFVRTYATMVARPRHYFHGLRDSGRHPSLVSPWTFWLVNVVVVKVLSGLHTEAGKLWSLSAVSDFAGLLEGLVLYPCFLVGILGIRGWHNLWRMLRIVCSCSVLLLPLYVLARIPPDDIIEKYVDSAFQGTRAAVSWYHAATFVLALGAFFGWFVLLGFGIRQVFRRTRLSIGLSLLALISVEFTLWVVSMFLYGVPIALGEVRRTVQLFSPARTALIQTPPDYARAAKWFSSMYTGRRLRLARRYRLGARIGRTAAELAYSAVMFKQPDVEKKLYDCQMAVIAQDNKKAAALLVDVTHGLNSSKDPVRRMLVTRKLDDELRVIRKMVADNSYDPDGNGASPAPTEPFEIPWPTPFP